MELTIDLQIYACMDYVHMFRHTCTFIHTSHTQVCALHTQINFLKGREEWKSTLKTNLELLYVHSWAYTHHIMHVHMGTNMHTHVNTHIHRTEKKQKR